MARQKVKGCKSKVTDRQSPKWKSCCWRLGDWEVYKGSSNSLTKDIKELGVSKFTFTIIRLCRSKGTLHYAEIEEQVKRGVLWKKLGSDDKQYLYYNRQIACCKFRPPSYFSDESRLKISERVSGEGHPLYGKVHPNRGKKLPQCAPKIPALSVGFRITDGAVTRMHPKHLPMPEGFRRGMTTKAKLKYEENPKSCRICGGIISHKDKKNMHCRECVKNHSSIIFNTRGAAT
ncbi:MAG: hypothetical protein KAS32_02505 [Candidatus Peribacteraceae bacterium]|nr:hypothetical protein [Candidatus Peribacteraceae bacterium]